MIVENLQMTNSRASSVTFARLPDISPDEIIAHMSVPRVAEHMPLLTFEWDYDAVAEFIAAKEARWHRDGLGHWAILRNGIYVGWGGFQKEGEEWEFGLVIKPQCFGLGTVITKKAIEFALADKRIPFVTILLPLSRKKLGAISRLGAKFVDQIEHGGVKFRKFRLDTA